MQMVEQIHGAKEQLLQLWHAKKLKLDQCFQLRHFELDCKKVLCKPFMNLLENIVSSSLLYAVKEKAFLCE